MAIHISLVAGRDQASSSVSASGSIQHVITDEERTSFHVNSTELLNAIQTYFGKKPTDAYLKSPTKWNDLYKTYSWPEVQMVLTVQSAEILSITSEPTIVKSQDFINRSSKSASYSVSISEEVTNTLTSSWRMETSLSEGLEISVSASFAGNGASATTSLSSTQTYGKEHSKSETVTLGSTAGVSIDLEPNEAVRAELTASRGKMKVRITYRASLSGCSAVNYYPTYKGHHFWGLPIASVMEAAKISNSMMATEDIEVGYYSNSSIVVSDLQTKAYKLTISMPDFPGGRDAEGDTLDPGEAMSPGQFIHSTRSHSRLLFQEDGNLVLYRDDKPVWSSGTAGKSVGTCIMQADGNLVIYSPTGEPHWATGTDGFPNSSLVLQADGNLVIYSTDGRALWQSNTVAP